ncbi:MAG: VOC family protein [Clostridia bacterium]|nr:VOC family protein [Clostridia bacterium]
MNSNEVKVGSCILAGDMDTMVRFYRDTLGLQTDWDGGNFAEFKTAGGPVSFWLYSRKEFVKAFGESYVPPKGINQSFELAFWLPTYKDVDAEYERLSKMGMEFPSGEPITYDFGIRNFYVADPEGNLIEIGSLNK